MSESAKIRGVVYSLIAAILWGSIGVAFKIGLKGGASGTWMIVGRPLFASALIVPYAVVKKERPTRWSLLVGGLGLAPLYISYFLAVELIGAALASVLLYTAPIWVTLISPLLTKDRLKVYDVVHVVLGVIGTWLVITQASLVIRINFKGALLGLTSGISYATYILLARYSQLKGARILEVGFYSIPIATIGVLAVIHPNKPPKAVDITYSLYLAILGTLIPYLLNAYALRFIRAPLVSVISLAEPLTAVLLAVLILGERMTLYQAVGSLLIIGSVASSAFHAVRE